MKSGHPLDTGAGPETMPDISPESAGTSPDVPPLARDGPQAQGVGQEAALAEAEDAQAPSVSHVQAATIGGRGGPRVGPYTLLGGNADGRYRLERSARRECEELARDQGYDSFAALPAARRGLTRRLAEVHVAASAMWAAGVTTGRLVDRWLDLTNAQNRLAQALGLERRLRDAKVLDLRSYIAEKYGRDGEGPTTPADSADRPSSAAEGPAEGIPAAQEAGKP